MTDIQTRIKNLLESAGHCERNGFESMAKFFKRKARYLSIYNNAPWRIRE